MVQSQVAPSPNGFRATSGRSMPGLAAGRVFAAHDAVPGIAHLRSEPHRLASGPCILM